MKQKPEFRQISVTEMEIPETFSGGKVSNRNFSDGKFSPGKPIELCKNRFFRWTKIRVFQEKITTDQLASFPRLVKKLNKFIFILASTKAPLKLKLFP